MKQNLLLILFIFASFSTYSQKGSSSSRSVGEFEYEGCGCKGDIDLKIFDGNTGGYLATTQNYWGGNEVKKTLFGGRHEFTDGAITIANLNNTDGDGLWGAKDIDDINGVLQNPKGRDEVDLMMLEIIPKNKFASQCSVKLEFVGDIRFYGDNKKINQITDLEFEILDNSGNPRNIILYVEARSVSAHMRDIEITAFLDGQEKDKVSATAIWVNLKNKYYSESGRIITPDPTILDIDNPDLLSTINLTAIQAPNGFRSKDNTRYGFGTFGEFNNSPYYLNEDLYFGGEVLFEFEIFPNDLIPEMKKFDITFDVARRKKVNDYFFTSYNFKKDTSPSNATDGSFPNENEEANDDPQIAGMSGDHLDEDNIPKNKEIFSFDAPSANRNYIGPYPVQPIGFRDVKFEEYVRVAFKNGSDLKGNKTSGSRCSRKIEWSLNSAMYIDSNHGGTDPYNQFTYNCQYSLT